ncbi:MAG: hypothetical protein SCK70_11025, partial [bacterium]|nr:hypothetical protein [bacterium]
NEHKLNVLNRGVNSINQHRNSCYFLMLWVSLFVIHCQQVVGQEKAQPPRLAVGLEFGHWTPANLISDPTATLKDAHKNPYLGLVLLKPWRFGLTFRVSGGMWSYAEQDEAQHQQRVKIASLLLDLKYDLLSDVFLIPYVTYGVGWFLGDKQQSKTDYFHFKDESAVGFAINAGTGFELYLSQRLCFAMEFRYHYIKFNHVVVFTDNYSGPKITISTQYIF